jgi:hypothetical protein
VVDRHVTPRRQPTSEPDDNPSSQLSPGIKCRLEGTQHGKFTLPGALGYDAIRDLEWAREEKAVARKAFDLALKRELEEVMIDVKKRAGNIRQPSDLWDLERYLTDRRVQIDRQYEHKYSVLILVFGNLIQQGRLTEQELQGLNEDKLNAIRRYVELNLRLA